MMLDKLYVTCNFNINAAVRAKTRRQTRLLLRYCSAARSRVDAYRQLGEISSRRRVNNNARAVNKRARADAGGTRQRAAVGITRREKRERGGRGLSCSGTEGGRERERGRERLQSGRRNILQKQRDCHLVTIARHFAVLQA